MPLAQAGRSTTTVAVFSVGMGPDGEDLETVSLVKQVTSGVDLLVGPLGP